MKAFCVIIAMLFLMPHPAWAGGIETIQAFRASDGTLFKDQKEALSYQLHAELIDKLFELEGGRGELFPYYFMAISMTATIILKHPHEIMAIITELMEANRL